MPNKSRHRHLKALRCAGRFVVAFPLVTAALFLTTGVSTRAQAPLKERLKSSRFKIAYECYINDNWDIFVMNADGSAPTNLTSTPKEHEHYPQVSPDGTKICFSVDLGDGRDAVRSLYVMDSDGKNRKKLAANAREPFWSPELLTQRGEMFPVLRRISRF